MILDTNAVSSLLSGDKDLGRVLGGSTTHHLPLVVVAEFLYGLQSSAKGARLQTIFRKLEVQSELLCPDRRTADLYAAIRCDLKQRGQPIPEGDLWISALARQHELRIVSRNEHFDLVREIERIEW